MADEIVRFLVIIAIGSIMGLIIGWASLLALQRREMAKKSMGNEKRYASDALISNLKAISGDAQANAKNQVATALTNLKGQKKRPAGIGYFDDIAKFYEGRVDEIEAFRKAGGKVVGYLCVFAPIELIRASGAIPLRVDSGFYSAITPSEQLFPSEACAVAKSTLGTAMLSLSPYLELCDAVICPSSCGMKAKLGEILEDFVPVWQVDVPGYKELPQSKSAWQGEIKKLKRDLEKLTGQEITRDKLKRSIESAQEARAAFLRLSELRKSKLPPVSGRDAMLVTQMDWYDDLERWTKKTIELCGELEQRVKNGVSVSDPETPRIMLAGSPIIWPNWKIPDLIEQSGAVVVSDELCSGDQGILSDPVNVDEWTMKDMLNAIADRYLQPCTCPCFTPNDKRMDKIMRMAKDCGIEGVVYHQLRGCYVHKIEFSRVRAALKELKIPVLAIETDYTQEDLGQLRTRVEAFLEMIQSAK